MSAAARTSARPFRVEHLNLAQFQRLFRLFSRTAPTHSNVAHAARVVLELLGIGFRRAGFSNHQDVIELPCSDDRLLANLVDLSTIGPVDGWSPPLGIAGRLRLRVRRHHDSRACIFEAVNPGRGRQKFPVFVLLGYSPMRQTLPLLSWAKNASSASTSSPSL